MQNADVLQYLIFNLKSSQNSKLIITARKRILAEASLPSIQRLFSGTVTTIEYIKIYRYLWSRLTSHPTVLT